ncbi:MAG: hypothetical protein AAF518_17540, partial [Spirochaetota bacterium]
LSSSMTSPIDVLTVELPQNKKIDRSKIKKGDKIEWHAGYRESGLIKEFEGEIFSISPKLPLEIVAKDYMYNLQGINLKNSLNKKTLKSFLKEYVSGNMEIKVDPLIENEKFSIKKGYRRSVVWTLLQLKKQKKVQSFFKGRTLHLQDPFKKFTAGTIAGLELDEFGDAYKIIEDNLQVQEEVETRIIVNSYNAKRGILYKGKYGESSWKRQKEYDIDGLSSNSECNKKAKKLYQETAGNSLLGSFTTFGYPSVSHSKFVKIKSIEEPTKNKNVFVKKVEKTFDAANATYRQIVHVGLISFKQENR